MIRIVYIISLLIFLESCKEKNTRKDIEIGDIETGVVVSKEGESLYPEEYVKAAKLIADNKIDKAITIYNHLLAIENEKVTALAGLGSCYSLKKEFLKALSYYRQSLKFDSLFMTSLIGSGSAHLSLKEYDSAIYFYNKAKWFKPEIPESYWGLAILYDEISERDNAKKNARKFIELAPNSMYRQLMEDILRK